MTDIAITYEDGLRLSELQGQLAQLQYDLAHVDVTSLPGKLGLCFILIIACLIVMWIVLVVLDEVTRKSFLGDASKGAVLTTGAVLVIVAFILIGMWAVGFYEQWAVVSIESNIANTQGQIDAIYAKYGGA